MPKRLKYKYHTENDPVLSDRVYVFSSNLAGLHRELYSGPASSLFGAQTGVSEGFCGKSYAIPVKDRFMRHLSLGEIKRYIQEFKQFTLSHPEMTFHVVRLENVVNSLKTWQIAPLFSGCAKNCSFPVQWKTYLK